MSEEVTIKIFPDGTVQAHVDGAKGKRCTDYIAILEELLEAQTVDSSFTDEYYQEVGAPAETVRDEPAVRRQQRLGGG